MAGALEAAAPLEVVRQLAVVHHGDVGERVGPVRVGTRDVHVGLGCHADVTDGVRAAELVQVVLLADGLGVAEVLDDLEGMTQREHFAVRNVLDLIGDVFEFTRVVERDTEGVIRLLLIRDDLGVESGETRLYLGTIALQPALELVVARRRRVRDGVAHDDVLSRLSVERIPGRIRAAMLHGLQHPGHVLTDVVLPILVNDSCDSAHGDLCPRW